MDFIGARIVVLSLALLLSATVARAEERSAVRYVTILEEEIEGESVRAPGSRPR